MHTRLLFLVLTVVLFGCTNRNDQGDPYGQVTSQNYRQANREVRRGNDRRSRRTRRGYPEAAFRDRELERSILLGVRAYARREGWSEHLKKVRILESFPNGYEIVVGGRFHSRRCVLHRMRVMAGYEGDFVVSDAIAVNRISCRAL